MRHPLSFSRRLGHDLPALRAARTVVFFVSTLEMGGAEYQLYVLCRELKARGLDPVVVSNHPGYWSGPLEQAGTLVLILSDVSPTRSALSAVETLLARPHVLVMWTWSNPALYLAWLRWPKSPLLVMINHDGTSLLAPGRITPLVARLFKQRAVMVANSRMAFDLLTAQGIFNNPLSRVIENGVAIPEPDDPAWHTDLRQSLDIPADAFVVGTVCNARPDKNLSQFFKVASLVHRRHPRVVFVHVGRNRLSDEEQAVLARVPDGVVRLAGPRGDGPRLAGAFDLYLLTSRHEGMPNSLLEAMAWARPVVSNNVGHVANIIDHGVNGFLVAVDDVVDMAARVEQVITRPAEAKAMGEKAREAVVNRYGTDLLAESFIDLFQQMQP